jgi:hypothetical protein
LNEIGSLVEDYEIKPIGKGAAKIKVTVKPPNGPAEVTEYELKIK